MTGQLEVTVHSTHQKLGYSGKLRSLPPIAIDYIPPLVASIIPGHGPVSSKKDVQEMKEYLVIFDAKAKELAAKSNDPDQIAAELKKALPSRTYFDMFIASNVKGLYLKK